MKLLFHSNHIDSSDLLYGPIAPLVSASSILVILVLMLIISYRLYRDRKKRGYRSISVSILLVIIQYMMMINLQLRNDPNLAQTQYLLQLLQVLSFIMINMGIYQLYNRSRMKTQLLFYGFITAALLIAGYYYYQAVTTSMNDQQLLLQYSFMDLYLFILIFLCFYMVAPYVGQRGKYHAAVTIYFIFHLSYVSNQYVFENDHQLLKVFEYFLPIVFYSIVFLYVLDRVIELLQSVYRSSITDGLTGLYNRAFFVNQIEKCLKKDLKVSLIFTDIDNFKKLNDTKGHQAGDEALKGVSEILKQEAEQIGIAGRYGGEELLMLIVNQKSNPAIIAERVRKRVEEEVGVTISVGYTKRKGPITAEAFLQQSDEAMYASKTSGKNKVTAYTSKRSGSAAAGKTS
ncbi:GGDEF domain-containing protein [Marinicrinis sediminis]|uniref:GGDEF domain-containing protein n=1 Tax=Marinicrinis sediminis TaxID=1652465 RepID=A0ABW5R8Y6_9BACL